MANAGVEFLQQNKEAVQEVGSEVVEEMAKSAKSFK